MPTEELLAVVAGSKAPAVVHLLGVVIPDAVSCLKPPQKKNCLEFPDRIARGHAPLTKTTVISVEEGKLTLPVTASCPPGKGDHRTWSCL